MAFYDELDTRNRFSQIVHRLSSYQDAVDRLLTEYRTKAAPLEELREDLKTQRKAALLEEYRTRLDDIRTKTAADIQSRLDLLDDTISAWMMKPAPAALLANLQALAATGVKLSEVEYQTFSRAAAGSYVCSRILDHLATDAGLTLTGNKTQPTAEQLAKSVKDAGSFCWLFLQLYCGEGQNRNPDFIAGSAPEPLRPASAHMAQRLRGDNALTRAALLWDGDTPQRLGFTPSREAREAVFSGSTHLERQQKLAEILDESPWLFESFASDPGTRADALAWKQAQQKQAGTATA